MGIFGVVVVNKFAQNEVNRVVTNLNSVAFVNSRLREKFLLYAQV